MRDQECSYCGKRNVDLASFCSNCGRGLGGATAAVGQTSHPTPAPVPDGFARCGAAADLYFRSESAWGGSTLLGTEGLGVSLFNAGYPLREVELMLTGRDRQGAKVFGIRTHLEQLPRGQEVKIEIPSYEISDPAQQLEVTLLSAEYES